MTAIEKDRFNEAVKKSIEMISVGAMISVGDLLLGSYLLTMSSYNSLVMKGNYCKNELSWLTSNQCCLALRPIFTAAGHTTSGNVKCITFGLSSTIGSQVSLFAMTALSLVSYLQVIAFILFILAMSVGFVVKPARLHFARTARALTGRYIVRV